MRTCEQWRLKVCSTKYKLYTKCPSIAWVMLSLSSNAEMLCLWVLLCDLQNVAWCLLLRLCRILRYNFISFWWVSGTHWFWPMTFIGVQVSGAEMDICNRFFRLYVAADMTDAEVDPLCGMLVVPSCTLWPGKWTCRVRCVICLHYVIST
jgi:hypothetical protein